MVTKILTDQQSPKYQNLKYIEILKEKYDVCILHRSIVKIEQ